MHGRDGQEKASTTSNKGFEFPEVFAAEWTEIAARRQRCGTRRHSDDGREGADAVGPGTPSALVALSLSGGGIRSAATSIGAIQALAARGLLADVDYISSVSGGAYANLVLQSATKCIDENVPCPLLAPNSGTGDSETIRGLRDYANFLVPKGRFDYFVDLAVVLRGFVANVLSVAAVLFFLAMTFHIFYPRIADFHQPVGRRILECFVHCHVTFGGLFPLTTLAAIVSLLFFIYYALLRGRRSGPDHFGRMPRAGARFLVTIAALAAFEAQPLLMTWLSDWLPAAISLLTDLGLPLLVAVLVLALLGSKLTSVIGAYLQSGGPKSGAAILIAHLANVGIAAVVPILVWIAFGALVLYGYDDAGVVAFYCKNVNCKVVGLYFVGWAVLLALAWLANEDSNANSLHGLYSGRIRRAFDRTETPAAGTLLSGLRGGAAPFPIINAALNIAGSKTFNARARNAAFFSFTPLASGSAETGYFKTTEVEAANQNLSAASIVATSGAAVSSYMGSSSSWLLAPSLALLNIRLGYWLTIPDRKMTLMDRVVPGLVSEMLGWLSEDKQKVYLTDGGHIENLGIYELLRRKCRVIIAVDAECDRGLAFGSLITLERYARIDLGVRIDLPWQLIRDGWGDASTPDDLRRVHCAVGRIRYSLDPKDTGVLIYIKSSLTGDEPDYVNDYKMRYDAFPHESTADAFFSEEQFEMYRTLGFHMLDRAFSGKDDVAIHDPTQTPPANGTLGRLTPGGGDPPPSTGEVDLHRPHAPDEDSLRRDLAILGLTWALSPSLK